MTWKTYVLPDHDPIFRKQIVDPTDTILHDVHLVLDLGNIL